MHIDIPTCSSCLEARNHSIRWNCSPNTARSIVQLASHDKKNFDEKARRAGAISEKQLRIAAELDDPTLLARCHLYFALSEAQQAKFIEARKILRNMFFEALQIVWCLVVDVSIFMVKTIKKRVYRALLSRCLGKSQIH
ncbi:hypothetical protein DICVIV_03348 [Dictyocaulus viviparus]|uniref:Uncharacterized protein n=1 Tax=Dictyocaulus viviparus TaxID=29172 RepID=A0A0D8Y0V0_DICVI|nr:hypothetical protein DICVIV_03348 [Dictyocaulus viviparus]